MDDLRARLQEDLTYHFKNRDELETSTLRSLLGTVQTLEKSGKVETVYTGEQILAVIGKEVKKRRDTAAEYTGLGVPERAARETAEADFLAAYLPAAPTEAEIIALVESVVGELDGPSIKDMGAVMKSVNQALAGAPVDGKFVAEQVRARLS